MNRKETLEAAIKTVCEDRQDSYGNPEDNFEIIAELWSGYLGDVLLRAEDVAVMMILLKAARIRTGEYKSDNYIDIAGYAACAAEIAGEAGLKIKIIDTGTVEPDKAITFVPITADQQEEKAEPITELKEKCDPAPKANTRRKDLDDGKIRALRKAGWTLEKIADEMGCATQTIKNRLDEYKIKSAT